MRVISWNKPVKVFEPSAKCIQGASSYILTASCVVFVWTSNLQRRAFQLDVICLCVFTDQALSWGIMDLVDANDGSGESDPHNSGSADSSALNGAGGRSSGGGNSGGSDPSHSQSSSAISIVHVSVPQAQVSHWSWSLFIRPVFVCYLFRLHTVILFVSKVQSVIQPTSVIQSTPSLQATSLPKGNIILVSKPNSVIHTTGGGGGAIQTLQVVPYITYFVCFFLFFCYLIELQFWL